MKDLRTVWFYGFTNCDRIVSGSCQYETRRFLSSSDLVPQPVPRLRRVARFSAFRFVALLVASGVMLASPCVVILILQVSQPTLTCQWPSRTFTQKPSFVLAWYHVNVMHTASTKCQSIDLSKPVEAFETQNSVLF